MFCIEHDVLVHLIHHRFCGGARVAESIYSILCLWPCWQFCLFHFSSMALLGFFYLLDLNEHLIYVIFFSLAFPDVEVTPFVKATLTEKEAFSEFGVLMVYSQATFECHANDLTDGYKYKTRWYINDIEMKDAVVEGLSKSDVEAGLGRMLEDHWTSEYKPNMIVKCAIQVGGEGFGTYGPQHTSDVFFAGLKVCIICMK